MLKIVSFLDKLSPQGNGAEPGLKQAFDSFRVHCIRTLAVEGFTDTALSMVEKLDDDFSKASALMGIVTAASSREKSVYDRMIDDPIREH
ncbi:MAG TPA: hypothetical protein DEB39_15040 [Planctomycetaceae bacterium]|nr:hypothetical protein [Planctomycetaceae bacterium]